MLKRCIEAVQLIVVGKAENSEGAPCAKAKRYRRSVAVLVGAFASVSASLSAAAAGAELPDEARWSYEKTPDPVADGDLALAVLEVPDVSVVLRCWASTSSLDLRFSVRPELGPIVDPIVDVTFDDERSKRAEWTLLPDGYGLEVQALSGRGQLLEKMQAGNLMSVHVTDESQERHRLRIPLGGSRAAISAVLRTCR